MSISQRRGTITLVPKEDSNLLHLTNWRPITLLNLDYKIASKAIAKRFKRVLKRLINTDQTGFIKDRIYRPKYQVYQRHLRANRSPKYPSDSPPTGFQESF